MPPAAISPEAKSEPGEISCCRASASPPRFSGPIHKPAHHAAAENGQRGADRQISSYGEGERANAQQFNRDHQ